MPVMFSTLSKRKYPCDLASQIVYSAIAKSIARADREAISKIIADISTVSVVDTDAAVAAFLKVVQDRGTRRLWDFPSQPCE